MGPDLRKHDLYPLLHHQGVLVVAHEFQVQPDIGEQTAADHGDGQIAQAVVRCVDLGIQHHRADDEQHAQNGNQRRRAPRALRFQEYEIQQVSDHHAAYNMAGVAQRAANKMIFIRDTENRRRKKRRQIKGGIQPDQPPEQLIAFARFHDIEKQQHHDGPRRIAVNGLNRSQQRRKLAPIQMRGKQILPDQTENQRDDPEHDSPLLFQDIRIIQHRQEQQQDLQKIGQQRAVG